MYVKANFGIVESDAGTLAVLVIEEVGDGILDTIGDKSRVAEVLAIDGGIDGKSGLYAHELFPVKGFELLIEVIGAVGAERQERLEYADRRTAGEVRPIEHLLVALEKHHAVTLGNILGAQCAQLVGEHAFQTQEGLRHHIKFISHHVQFTFSRRKGSTFFSVDRF